MNAPVQKNILIWMNIYDGYDDAVAFVGYKDKGGHWRTSPDGEECSGTVIAWAELPEVSVSNDKITLGEPDLVPIEEVRRLIRAYKDSQIMGDDGALAATRRAAEALYEVDDAYLEYADGGIGEGEFVSKVEKALGYTEKIKAALRERKGCERR